MKYNPEITEDEVRKGYAARGFAQFLFSSLAMESSF
jgi:hypothetical protein